MPASGSARRHRGRSLLLLAALGVACTSFPAQDRAHEVQRPNVLLICIDDLREPTERDREWVRAPNLERLAAEGRQFRRHYAVVPTCGASRCAMLTGLRPTRERLGNDAFERLPQGPDAPRSWPQRLREAGYRTESLGKISHSPDGLLDPGRPADERRPELPGAWDRTDWDAGRWGSAWNAFFGYADGSTRVRGSSPPFERVAREDEHEGDTFVDELLAQQAVARLAALNERDEPFLLAVGFVRPHLPWVAPDRLWRDLGPEDLTVPAGPFPHEPYSWHGSGELLGNYGAHLGDPRTDADHARRLHAAYLASVALVDEQIGLLLDAVDDLGLRDDTIVVLWSDHGWQLGEHGLWGKHSLYEEALHCPLIVRAPGVVREPGVPSDDPVDSLDLAPTLLALCGVDDLQGLEGRDLRADLADPTARASDLSHGWWRSGAAVGSTVRSATHRLIRWTPRAGETVVEFEQLEGDVAEDQEAARTRHLLWLED